MFESSRSTGTSTIGFLVVLSKEEKREFHMKVNHIKTVLDEQNNDSD